MSTVMNSDPPPRRQTTVLLGGSNGTAALVSILGDRSKPENAGHTLRVVSRHPSRFRADGENGDGRPLKWRCDEQKPFSDLAPSELLPTTWTTHVGEADSVFGYDEMDDVPIPGSSSSSGSGAEGGNGGQQQPPQRRSYSGLERAISGLGSHDDGGPADVLLMCCPVSAHLPILRRVARALYRLEADGALALRTADGRTVRRPPLLIGTLYAAGGFDWMCRIAFTSEKPATFPGVWSRDLALFGLKAFPYLCKSTKPGVVTMYGRYPVLTCAISPSTPRVRARATEVLQRALQCDTTGKYLHFLGLSGPEHYGGDGSAEELGTDVAAAAAMAAASAAAHSVGAGGKGGDGGKAGASKVNLLGAAAASTTKGGGGWFSGKSNAGAANGQASFSVAMPMADHADPHSSLGFLTCTMNATNQILHPCICAALFHDPANPSASDADGTIPWDASREKTPLPRFYADGASHAEAGRLITAVAAAEMYPLIDVLDKSLAPAGMAPVCRMHGGEPVGHFIMQELGNGPAAVGERSGLTEMALSKLVLEEDGEEADTGAGDADDNGGGAATSESAEPIGATRERTNLLNYRRFFEWAMSYGLSHNTRLGSVLSPALILPNDDSSDTSTKYIKPNVKTRFFTDDIPNGLCIVLGLAELYGYDLERDMPETLGLVRRLQRWMGKEYVVPAATTDNQTTTLSLNGRKVRAVADARDLAETSAPQAFGVRTVRDLRNFLAMSPFAEDVQGRMENRVGASPLVSRL